MCWYCGEPVTEAEPIGRSMRCTVCGKDLRCCRGCKHWLSGGGCNESQGEQPSDPERACFCGWFALNPRFREATPGEKAAQRKAEAAKAAFQSLFS